MKGDQQKPIKENENEGTTTNKIKHKQTKTGEIHNASKKKIWTT